MTRRTARHFGFLLAFVLFALGRTTEMRANASDFCTNWKLQETNCSCDVTNDYTWSMSCDFSDYGDGALEEGTAFCDDAFSNCSDQMCQDAGYAGILQQQCEEEFGDDPCCDAQYWDVYADESCANSASPTMSCGCAGYDWCIG